MPINEGPEKAGPLLTILMIVVLITLAWAVVALLVSFSLSGLSVLTTQLGR